MKLAKYGLLCFCTGVYFAIGGYGFILYFFSLLAKLSRRDQLMNGEEVTNVPYPYIPVIGMYVLLAIYVFLGVYLLFLLYKQMVIFPQRLIKFGVCIFMLYSGFILAKGGVDYWNSIPPMSKEKAIQVAMGENQKHQSLGADILKEAYWDKKNQAWIIRFSDEEGFRCDTYTISRLELTFSDGSCDK